MPTRREKIEAMLAQEPEDRFLRYALALELEKEGAHDRSLGLFAALMASDPPHVPSFLMAGQHLAARNEIDEARRVLREGIDAARKQGETHAAGEMADFLAGLGDL
jgi:hypothetical protein